MLTQAQRKLSVRSDTHEEADKMIPAAVTDTGCERELNEDRYAVVECESGVAWIVCDGMGGAKGGELAAQLVIDCIRLELERLPKTSVANAVKHLMTESNRAINLRRQNPAFADMGTTLVVVMFDGTNLAVGHCGDSRAYLVRDSAIQQLTRDHTYVQDLVDQGQITVEEAMSHPQAHVLTRCVGSEINPPIDIEKFWIWESVEYSATDYLVLCTDGLYSLLSDGEICSIVATSSPQKACVQLVETARARGGYDNITVAIVPLGGQMKSEPQSPVASQFKGRDQSAPFSKRGWMMMILGMLSFGLLVAVLIFLGIVG